MPFLIFFPTIVKQVDIPLYDVPSISKLLIDRLFAEGVTTFIILRITYIVNITFLIIIGQFLILINVVNTLSIRLILQLLWQFLVASY